MGAREQRQQVADLVDTVTGVTVIPYPAERTPKPGEAIAIVRMRQIGPTELQPDSLLRYTLTITLAVASTDPGKSDDELDDLLSAVLTALDPDDAVIWTLATRTEFMPGETVEGYPAYNIDVETRGAP